MLLQVLLILLTLNYNLKILNLIESKLTELLTQLKVFKFVTTLVLVFKKIESED